MAWARGQAWLTGAIAGAGLMYFLDPERGRRRRALMRDRGAHLRREVDRAAGVVARDIQNRAEGVVAEVRSRLQPDAGDDDTLRERVRAELGRVVSHPGAIEVWVESGRVTLSGPVLADEVDRLISRVRSVRGVESVENRLEVHESPGNIPALQGGKRREAAKPELLQQNWAPAPRLFAGTLGAALAIRGLSSKSALLRAGLTGAGTALFLRALTNLPVRRLTGIGAGRRAVELRKDINVDAPVEEVFAFWDDPENFPRFMSHVKEVRRVSDNRTHWVAEGPGGVRVEWDAETTEYAPNELICWRSVEGSSIEHAGIVRFQPNEHGGTRVTIQMSYNPPLGAIGHTIASLLGADPLSRLHEDMVRFKSLIEEGRTSVRGETVEREELRKSA